MLGSRDSRGTVLTPREAPNSSHVNSRACAYDADESAATCVAPQPVGSARLLCQRFTPGRVPVKAREDGERSRDPVVGFGGGRMLWTQPARPSRSGGSGLHCGPTPYWGSIFNGAE